MNDIDILEQQAVDAAMNHQWDTAVKLNEKILNEDSKNLAACLRLGFTYLQMKNIEKAKKFYQKALRIQPKNHVAEENIERLLVLEEQGTKKTSEKKNLMNPTLFLEIPGKTKSIALVNIGQKKDLAELAIGEEVELKQKKRKIEARTKSGEYIGCLPDDLSKRLIFLMKQKSRYIAYVKEANLTKVLLFIQEISKGKKVSHFLSFPHNIQTNLERMNVDSTPSNNEALDDESEGADDEWDRLEHELNSNEEKEELIEIHHEEEDVEE